MLRASIMGSEVCRAGGVSPNKELINTYIQNVCIVVKRVDPGTGSSNSYRMKATKTAQTAATKSRLEMVARDLFGARGFEAVSAEELVAKADVTRGALYHHYDGKEGLFAAVVETLMRELHAQLAREAA